jgi:predicted RNase H-like nuclease (RuvC/YqgF family)
MALGRGVPGALEENIEKLTNLIAEEFKEALSEDEGEKKKTALQRLQDRYNKAAERHKEKPNNANRKRLEAAERALNNEKERVAAATKRAKEAEKGRATRTAGGGTSGKPSGAK